MELISEKTYYKRYRICVEHCNMHSLVLDGRRLRFCQQCGRFHELTEFEGQRKSCRRKLKRHNERRRAAPVKGSNNKWQSDSDCDIGIDNSEDEAEMKAVANIKRGTARTRTLREKIACNCEGSEQAAPVAAECHRSLTDRLLHATRDMVGMQDLGASVKGTEHSAGSGGPSDASLARNTTLMSGGLEALGDLTDPPGSGSIEVSSIPMSIILFYFHCRDFLPMVKSALCCSLCEDNSPVVHDD